MKQPLKNSFLVLTGLIFIIANVLCCCVIKNQIQASKPICSHCASKDGKASPIKECCFSKASPMELAKNQIFHWIGPIGLAFIAFALIQLLPANRLTLKSLYINGPPGPYTLIPLYIKARSIRI